SFAQLGGTASLGAVSGTGTLAIGAFNNPPTAAASVTSLAQRALTVSQGGTLRFLAAAAAAAGARVTNTAGALSILGNGKLDLANQDLLTSTAAGTVRAYLVTGYHGGDWAGAGLTSSVAAANPNVYSVGYTA